METSSQFNTQQKAVELSIEHLVKSIEQSTTTTDKEIFYYNFSLIGLQLFLINKIFDVVEKSNAVNLFLETSIICVFIFVSIVLAICSTINLLEAYQKSKVNNYKMLESLMSGDFTLKSEKSAQEQNKIIEIKYSLANKLCMKNLWLFVAEIALIILLLYWQALLPQFHNFFN